MGATQSAGAERRHHADERRTKLVVGIVLIMAMAGRKARR